MEMNKIYEVVNRLNLFYDMIDKNINVQDIISNEELKLLIDYINLMEERNSTYAKDVKRKIKR